MDFGEFASSLTGYLEGGDARSQVASGFLKQPPEDIIQFVEPENFAAIISFAAAAGKVPTVISEALANPIVATDSHATASSAVEADEEDDLGEREDFGEAFVPTSDVWSSNKAFACLVHENPINLLVDPRCPNVKEFLENIQKLDPLYAAKVALCLNYGKSIPGLRVRLYTPKESR